MSSESVYEYARKFDELLGKAKSFVETASANPRTAQPVVVEMEQCLSDLELEVSLLGGSATAEQTLLRTCRAHFNDLRRQLAAAEEARSLHPVKDDIEALHAKYGTAPLIASSPAKTPLLRRRLAVVALTSIFSVCAASVFLL